MFNEKDKALHKGLLDLLNDGDFTVKMRAAPKMIAIYNWVLNMPSEFIRKPEEIKETAIKTEEEECQG